MRTLKFTPKSYIRHVGKEILVLDGSLTLDIANDIEELPMELESFYYYLESFGTWEEVNQC